MRIENPLMMLAATKGAAISVLCALIIARQQRLEPVEQAWIERATNYTDKPVSQALMMLQDWFLVAQDNPPRGPWRLTSQAVQLPLMQMLDSEISPKSSDPAMPAAGKDGGNSVDSGKMVIELSRKDSESESFRLDPSSSSRSINLDSRNLDLLLDSRQGESENFRLVLAELDKAGIREPARSRLAKLPHVTVDLVRYHCQTCKPGQAIYRIERNWPIKTSPCELTIILPGEVDDVVDDVEDESPAINQEHNTLFAMAMAEVAAVLPRGEYENWVRPARLWCTDGCPWIVAVANTYTKDRWLTMGVPAKLTLLLGVQVVVEVH